MLGNEVIFLADISAADGPGHLKYTQFQAVYFVLNLSKLACLPKPQITMEGVLSVKITLCLHKDCAHVQPMLSWMGASATG